MWAAAKTLPEAYMAEASGTTFQASRDSPSDLRGRASMSARRPGPRMSVSPQYPGARVGSSPQPQSPISNLRTGPVLLLACGGGCVNRNTPQEQVLPTPMHRQTHARTMHAGSAQ
eukprot:4624348-Alexandrium_andersonii.AAC.1